MPSSDKNRRARSRKQSALTPQHAERLMKIATTLRGAAIITHLNIVGAKAKYEEIIHSLTDLIDEMAAETDDPPVPVEQVNGSS
jgi:hypothetical protein